MKKRTGSGITKGVLLYSAPFVLISAAIVFLLLWGTTTFVEGNILYKLLASSTITNPAYNPEYKVDGDTGEILYPGESPVQLILTEKEKEILKKNNKNIGVSDDFPIITLGEQWATITIESAQVDHVPVLHGDYDENLMLGIGHSSNSRFPGQGGKVVLSGHVGIYEHFQRLENMKVGDVVKLETTYGDYEYKVVETVIFDQEDPSLLLMDDPETEKLICYTCYPFHTTSVRTQRFAIICEMISGKNWKETD